MGHPYEHARSSAKRFGGKPEDYLAIHQWFDETKAWFPQMQHRAMRHHAEGIFEAEKIFGHYITNSDGKKVYVRYIGEQHVIEDLGFIPTAADWLLCMDMQKWMMAREERIKKKKLPGNELPTSLIDLLNQQNMQQAEQVAVSSVEE